MKTKTTQIFSTGCPYDNISQTNAKRILFVCSVGMLRSPTAQMVASQFGLNARAAGSAVDIALVPISCNLIDWAQHIVFMNRENYHEARRHFVPIDDYANIIDGKSVVWDIPDHYNWGETALWSILYDKVKVFV